MLHISVCVSVAAFYVAFIDSSCEPSSDPCVFQSPLEAVLGTITMSVGDFEDIAGTFNSSRFPTLLPVS